MHADFHDLAKEAKANLLVPEVPLERILMRSEQVGARGRLRSVFYAAAISLATVGTAAALSTGMFRGVQIWIDGNRGTVAVHSFAMMREPTRAAVQRVVAKATFPVIFPLGLPPDARVSRLTYAPEDRPNAFFIEYRGRSWKRATLAIFDSSAVHSGSASMPGGQGVSFHDSVSWNNGRETVLALKGAFSARTIDQIKKATAHATADSSLALASPMFSKAIVLGTAPELAQIADRYGSGNRGAVVIGPQLVRTVPAMAVRHQPLLDSSLVILTNIPSVQGQPDYAKATLRWPRTIAISSDGVRAIAAVLQTAGGAEGCGCDVVIARPAGQPFEVWEVSSKNIAVARAYVVNPATFSVKRADR